MLYAGSNIISLATQDNSQQITANSIILRSGSSWIVYYMMQLTVLGMLDINWHATLNSNGNGFPPRSGPGSMPSESRMCTITNWRYF